MEFIESMIKSTTGSNNEGDAYGAGMAGAPFDPLSFIKKPQVIIRIVSVVLAIVVFSCIASEDLYKEGTCPLNEDSTACGFGITIGVTAFLICLFFLLVDAKFDSFSNVKTRKRAVIVDLAISAAWTLLWFICFCYIANSWRKTEEEIKARAEVNTIQTAIAFSFFSIITWAMITLLNFLRYRQGISTLFSSDYESHMQNDDIGIQGDDNMNDGQAPFNNNASYQQPTY